MCEKWVRSLTLWLALALLVVALMMIGACGETPGPEPTSASPEVPKATEEPVETETTERPTRTDTPTPVAKLTCEPGDERNPCVFPERRKPAQWPRTEQGTRFATADGVTWVEGEVIVTGPYDEVMGLAEEILGDQAHEPRYLLKIRGLIPSTITDRLPPGWLDDGEEIVIGRFETDGSTPAPDVVREFNGRADDEGLPVFAELNLVYGHPQIWAGSPQIWAGSPQTWAGSPLKLDGVSVIRKFWGQWAFGPPPGIDLVEISNGTGTRRVPDKGDGVQIAIFDSSPFTATDVWDIGWITPTLTLTVSQVLKEATGLEQPTVPISPSDHGLFVAGLAHAVAPSSTIHLVQALNDHLTGTEATLNYALVHYMDSRLSANNQSLTNTVLNFSLGLPLKRGSVADLPPPETYAEWIQAFYDETVNPEDLPLPSFATLIALADFYEATMVAAAGNTEDKAEDIVELPAAYPVVIGVEANSIDGGETCYTRSGVVAAPGGDPDASGGNKNKCPQEYDSACERGIISLGFRTSRCAGYICWIGTSFSAPLVSGELAALLGHFKLAGQTVSREDLLCIIRGSKSAGPAPTINLSNTFANPICPP